MAENKICAFTGHRVIEPKHFPLLEDLLSRAIVYAYGKGCKVFICGGALGFDTMAAKAVIKFRISHPDVSLVMYIPCFGQEKKWSFTQQNAYNYVLNAANEVVYTSDSYTSECMKVRNKAIANDADIVIAYVNNSRSGSAQTVRMATSLGKEVYNLYPTLAAESAGR